MKRTRLYLLLCTALVVSLTGCEMISRQMFESFHESYIDRYYDVDLLGECQVQKHDNLTYNFLMPYEMYARKFAVYEPKDEQEKLLQTRHKELSQRNGDVGFQRWCSDEYGWCPDGDVWNTDHPITSIDIVSDADFDAEHPAGVPLNDIVSICYDTHKPYIDNGYVHPDASRVRTNILPYGKEVCAADFKSENSLFMCRLGTALKFHYAPTAATQHTFIVTVTLEGKSPYSFSFDADFEAAE